MADKSVEGFIGKSNTPDLWLRQHPRYATLVLVATLLATGADSSAKELPIAEAVPKSSKSSVIYKPNSQSRPSITASQARRKIQETLEKATNSFGNTYQSVQVTMAGFSFLDPGEGDTREAQARSYQFNNLGELAVVNQEIGFFADKRLVLAQRAQRERSGVNDARTEPGKVPLPGTQADILCWWSQTDARDFVDAVCAMRYYSSSAAEAATFAEFKEKAAAWRALPQKPEIPEDARRYMVLFADAFQNKELEKAADYAEQGLAVCPLWPDMQFNAALVCGEAGTYAMALCHMKRYLELCPDSPKARDAQNKMYIWEEKLK